MPKTTQTPRSQVTVGLDFEVLAKLREMAQKEKTTVTKLIEHILVNFVTEREKEVKLNGRL